MGAVEITLFASAVLMGLMTITGGVLYAIASADKKKRPF